MKQEARRRSARPLSPWELRLLAVAPVLLCGVFVWVQVRTYLRIEAEVAAAADWVKTPCVVVLAQKLSGSRHASPRLAVRYEYTFDGQAYSGETYRLGAEPSLLFDQADWFVREHPAGSESICYVNPAAPSEAVLNRTDYENPTRGIALFGAAGGLWALVGVAMWRTAARGRSSR